MTGLRATVIRTRFKTREDAMGLLIVRHKVKDFAAWKKAFDGVYWPQSLRRQFWTCVILPFGSAPTRSVFQEGLSVNSKVY